MVIISQLPKCQHHKLHHQLEGRDGLQCSHTQTPVREDKRQKTAPKSKHIRPAYCLCSPCSLPSPGQIWWTITNWRGPIQPITSRTPLMWQSRNLVWPNCWTQKASDWIKAKCFWSFSLVENKHQEVSGCCHWLLLFYRCFHREPRWEIHHHICRCILSLFLKDEATCSRGKASWKGVLETRRVLVSLLSPLRLFICAVLLQVLDQAIETEKMIDKYETLASDLLTWIEQTIIVLNNRKLANSLTGVQQQLQAFNTYRTVEKPPK